MATITLRLDVKELKDARGRKTGRVSCKIGMEEFYADNREELTRIVWESIQAAMLSPSFSVVRGEFTESVLIGHRGNIETYAIKPGKGIASKRHTSYCSGDIKTESERQALHLAQFETTSPDDAAPDWLPSSMLAEFQSWQAWQGRYRAAIQAGHNDNEAHRIACNMGHVNA